LDHSLGSEQSIALVDPDLIVMLPITLELRVGLTATPVSDERPTSDFVRMGVEGFISCVEGKPQRFR
jgi:hypothetical protein